jgi:uncharacterized membrane protein
MKKLLELTSCLGAVFVLALGTTGCDKKDAKKDPAAATKKTNVALAADPSAWTGKPEEKGEVKLKLTREADAKEEVTFEVKSESDSVKASADKVAGDKTEGTLKLEIAKDAMDGNVKVTITAKSKDSKDSAATATITVKKGKADPEPVKDKKEVSLSPDKAPLKLKQGDKGDATFKVGTKGGAKDANVAVKGETPKGLKVTVGEIKDGEVKVTVAAADDAKVDDHPVTIEATAEGASAVSATLTVTVEKKK